MDFILHKEFLSLSTIQSEVFWTHILAILWTWSNECQVGGHVFWNMIAQLYGLNMKVHATWKKDLVLNMTCCRVMIKTYKYKIPGYVFILQHLPRVITKRRTTHLACWPQKFCRIGREKNCKITFNIIWQKSFSLIFLGFFYTRGGLGFSLVNVLLHKELLLLSRIHNEFLWTHIAYTVNMNIFQKPFIS